MSMTPGAPVQTQGPMPNTFGPYQQGGNVFNQSANALTAATNTAQGAANYTPQQVTAPSLATTSLDPYMNPYTQAVTDQTMQQLAEQQQMALNDVGAQASAAGAFGGSRQGVVEGQTYDAYAQAQADALANLNSQNFTQAQQAAMYDTNNSLAAQVANQNAGLQGAGLNLNAAGQLGALSQTGFDQGNAIIGQQSSQGALMQGINQMLIDAAKGQYAGFTGAPNQSLQQLLSATGVPTGSTTTQTQQPGLFDYLTLGLNAIAPA